MAGVGLAVTSTGENLLSLQALPQIDVYTTSLGTVGVTLSKPGRRYGFCLPSRRDAHEQFHDSRTPSIPSQI